MNRLGHATDDEPRLVADENAAPKQIRASGKDQVLAPERGEQPAVRRRS